MGRKKKSTNLSLFPILLGTLLSLSFGSRPLSSQAVLTRSYDNRRSGGNTQEKDLTPASVGSVKKLREFSLDSDDDPRLEAQPLYVARLQMADGPHDVVIVSTMANNIYAFDVPKTRLASLIDEDSSEPGREEVVRIRSTST